MQSAQLGFRGSLNSRTGLLNEFEKTLDSDASYAINLEYDEQLRIKKIRAINGSIEEVTDIIYASDGSYAALKSVNTDYTPPIESPTTLKMFGQAALMSSEGFDNVKRADPGIDNRIELAKDLWEKANNNGDADTKALAHIEANVARADYCVVYPESTFAEVFLEDGNLNTGNNFRRSISYNVNNPMYGYDIIAIQRALMAYGYLDPTEVKLEDYGHYGPTTQAAVNDYQQEEMGIKNPNGKVDGSVIKRLFSDPATTSNNKAQVSFAALNAINIFKSKHDSVVRALEAKVNDGATTWREAYIAKAGIKGNGGRADLVKQASPTNYVWEVKPDSAYGKATGAKQVATYVNSSTLSENMIPSRPWCPMTYGYSITAFAIPWTSGTSVLVSSTCKDGTSAAGVVYYRDNKYNEPVYKPYQLLLPAPKLNEDYKSVSAPSPAVVRNGLVTIGAIVVTYYLIKGAIALAAAAPTGGASLILLGF